MTTTLSKNKTAEVGKYSYQYVDIAQIHEYLESINCTYYQYIERIDGDDYIMTVPIMDGKELNPRRGCKVVDATLMGVHNPAQSQGSALTYARRYSLLMAFGLATEDNDAQDLTREIEVDEEYAKNYTFEFGKKHKGHKLVDVIKDDPSYIEWLLKNESTSPDLLKSIEILTGEKPKEVDLNKTQKLMNLIVEKGIDTDKVLEYYKVNNLNDLTEEQIDEIIAKRG